MRRQLSRWAFCMVLAAALAGCGGQRATPTTTAESAATSTSSASPAVASVVVTRTASLGTRTAATSSLAATPTNTGARRLSLTINEAQTDVTSPTAGGVVLFVRLRNETNSALTVRIADFRVRDSSNYIYKPNEQWSTAATTRNGGKEFSNGELALDGREVATVVLWVPEAHRSTGLHLTYVPDQEIALPFTPR